MIPWGLSRRRVLDQSVPKLVDVAMLAVETGQLGDASTEWPIIRLLGLVEVLIPPVIRLVRLPPRAVGPERPALLWLRRGLQRLLQRQEATGVLPARVLQRERVRQIWVASVPQRQR